ncbi:MAG: tRNA pseudouridine(38-40) synthase TruA [Christensenellaceae bacterium]|jgi:tRNA pseudouridine38-40 synthase|nr:tRNA pseudouridine(38-40) synthase TruA [Christensenellaceae bacterium]
MRRIALILEYDGGPYCGWQRQKNGLSVQAVAENALKRLCGEEIALTGASRTDAGVHALYQVAHFDTESRIPAEKFSFALNTLLPSTIRVTGSLQVRSDFHARFDAKGKSYEYRILNRPHQSALKANTHAHLPTPLDFGAMAEAAALFLGRHDFSAFMAAGGSAKTFTREMTASTLQKNGDELLFTICGSGFLYNMVRIIAGTLIAIGQGKLAPGCIPRAYQSRSRLDLGPTAPAHGLCLTRVFYDSMA